MPDFVFLHNYLILDACCIINLCASMVIESVLSTLPVSVAVAKDVEKSELLYVYTGPDEDVTQNKSEIDLQPLVDSRLIEIVSLDMETEAETYVRFASLLHDGEAITGAIAIHRNWAIGTDEKKATRIFKETAPKIQIISTPELMKFWAENNNPPPEIAAKALKNIYLRATYLPNSNHTLYNWWMRTELAS